MTPSRKSWWLFAGCVAAVVAALGWITTRALDIERSEREARAQLEQQEAIRMALWRMDSAFTPILAQEAARPADFYSLENPQLPSINPNFYRVYFQVNSRNEVASRPLSLTKSSSIGGGKGVPPPSRLPDLLGWLDVAQLRSHCHAPTAAHEPLAQSFRAEKTDEQVMDLKPQQAAQQLVQQKGDYSARSQNVYQAQSVQNGLNAIDPNFITSGNVGVMRAFWMPNATNKTQELVLVRDAAIDEELYLQGVWVDWQSVKKWLLSSIKDIFPEADLVPTLNPADQPQDRLLASIPVKLEVGNANVAHTPFWSPLKRTLMIVWIAVLISVTAAGFVLRASIDLSERRGRFVSAVTHELRTPLTTFTLYSQMLADGMVTDDSARREYLETLKKESERLSRIVENVLLYARVEGRRALTRVEQISIHELIDRILPKLELRAKDCGFQIQVNNSVPASQTIRTDAGMLEQILVNLVDNSCKYASDASDKTLYVEISNPNGKIRILYSDRGPGIPDGEENRIFEPFQRSSRESSGTIPGIGLGLSLSRAMAQELGGDLTLDRTAGSGAAFVIDLSV